MAEDSAGRREAATNFPEVLSLATGQFAGSGYPALLQRRELHRDDDLGFLMQQRTKLLVLAQKIMPGRILGHFGAAPRAVIEVRKAPEMNHLIERADLGLKEADQIAEVFLLHRQRAFFIERKPFAHFERHEIVGSVIVDHGCVSWLDRQ